MSAFLMWTELLSPPDLRTGASDEQEAVKKALEIFKSIPKSP